MAKAMVAQNVDLKDYVLKIFAEYSDDVPLQDIEVKLRERNTTYQPYELSESIYGLIKEGAISIKLTPVKGLYYEVLLIRNKL